MKTPAPTNHARTDAWRSLAAVLALITAGVRQLQPAWRREISGDLKSIMVGSADFPESKIIAEIYAQALEANGFTVGRQFGIGSRETYIPAVQDHSIDLIPEYTGNLLQYFDPKSDRDHARRRASSRCSGRCPATCRSSTPSPADDKDTVAVTEATAQRGISRPSPTSPRTRRK